MTDAQTQSAPRSLRRMLKVSGVVVTGLVLVATVLALWNWTEIKCRYYIWSFGSDSWFAVDSRGAEIQLDNVGFDAIPFLIDSFNDFRRCITENMDVGLQCEIITTRIISELPSGLLAAEKWKSLVGHDQWIVTRRKERESILIDWWSEHKHEYGY